jgi:hypothetical protein
MEILSKLPTDIKSKIFLFLQHPLAKIINNSIMEILSKLPKELKGKVFLFLQHPLAKLINDSIINEDCDDDRLRLLYYPCYFYKPIMNRKYNNFILLIHRFNRR